MLQIVAAIGAGVLLAYLVDYLDDSLHDGEQTATILGVPLLASVPLERRS
jgi:capsular polysaccharide biosynthesis protein